MSRFLGVHIKGFYCTCLQFNVLHGSCAEGLHFSALVPIFIAAAVWGCYWQNKAIMCHCDNEAVVCIINSGTSKDPKVMSLLRCLFFFAAKHKLMLFAAHIPGSSNVLADALSRNKVAYFLNATPQAPPSPTPIPQELLDLLLHYKPDWTSPSWSTMFRTICSQLSHPLPKPLMLPPIGATQTSAIEQAITPTPPMKISSVHSQDSSERAN